MYNKLISFVLLFVMVLSICPTSLAVVNGGLIGDEDDGEFVGAYSQVVIDNVDGSKNRINQ